MRDISASPMADWEVCPQSFTASLISRRNRLDSYSYEYRLSDFLSSANENCLRWPSEYLWNRSFSSQSSELVAIHCQVLLISSQVDTRTTPSGCTTALLCDGPCRNQQFFGCSLKSWQPEERVVSPDVSISFLHTPKQHDNPHYKSWIDRNRADMNLDRRYEGYRRCYSENIEFLRTFCRICSRNWA